MFKLRFSTGATGIGVPSVCGCFHWTMNKENALALLIGENLSRQSRQNQMLGGRAEWKTHGSPARDRRWLESCR